jgi:hypothetical protein
VNLNKADNPPPTKKIRQECQSRKVDELESFPHCLSCHLKVKFCPSFIVTRDEEERGY